jgi:hypothetical protein
MQFFIPFVFIVVIMGLFLALSYNRLKKLHEAMAGIATDLGLTYSGAASSSAPGASGGGQGGIQQFLQVFNTWRLEGTRDGVRVASYTETRGSGRSRTTYTIVEAFHPAPLGCGLHLGRENALTKLGESLFNLKDIQVGSPTFDATVRIKGSDPEKVKSLLSSTRIQDAILQAMEKYPSILVQDDRVRFELARTYRTTDEFRPIFDTVISVVKAMAEG